MAVGVDGIKSLGDFTLEPVPSVICATGATSDLWSKNFIEAIIIMRKASIIESFLLFTRLEQDL